MMGGGGGGVNYYGEGVGGEIHWKLPLRSPFGLINKSLSAYE